MLVGFVYYHKKVAGNAWMSVTGMTEEKAREGNMAVIFGVSYLLSIMLAFMLSSIVIHQNGLFSLFAHDQGSELFKQVSEATKGKYRTFGHGTLHGVISGLFFALPVLGINALYEQRGWKYIIINVVYWCITLGIMGGLLCAWI